MVEFQKTLFSSYLLNAPKRWMKFVGKDVEVVVLPRIVDDIL